MTDQLEMRRRRASFRASHRGTREMDWLLGRYADATLSEMVDPALAVFENLLQLPDPDLHAWILDPALIDQHEFAELIATMRTFHKLDQPVT